MEMQTKTRYCYTSARIIKWKQPKYPPIGEWLNKL